MLLTPVKNGWTEKFGCKPNRACGGFFSAFWRKECRGTLETSGTILTRSLAEGGGITIGRNLMTNRLNSQKTYPAADDTNINVSDFNNFLGAHETGHYDQQINMGFGTFYMNKLLQGFSPHSYLNSNTLEGQANQYSINKIGFFYDPWGIKHTKL